MQTNPSVPWMQWLADAGRTMTRPALRGLEENLRLRMKALVSEYRAAHTQMHALGGERRLRGYGVRLRLDREALAQFMSAQRRRKNAHNQLVVLARLLRLTECARQVQKPEGSDKARALATVVFQLTLAPEVSKGLASAPQFQLLKGVHSRATVWGVPAQQAQSVALAVARQHPTLFYTGQGVSAQDAPSTLDARPGSQGTQGQALYALIVRSMYLTPEEKTLLRSALIPSAS